MTMPTIDGYELLRVEPLHVRAKLPAAVWRVLSVAARPDPWCNVRPVVVDDAGTPAVVLTAAHYDELVCRLRDLETWAAEGEGQP
jgi:hypothetical protein